ncbi:MAG: nickel-dependent lactate racemase [Candidatus Latescibacterota bacterium]|nr:MAG: nickel-dependent lactate racemase [Candidatus Latescibacterota bacterium]
MKIDFPYKGIEGVEIPDANLLGIFEPKRPPVLSQNEDELINEGLSHPIGLPPVEQIVRPGREIVIISDDNTRLTPVANILPLLAERLQEGGASRGKITILVASGTHRPMTDAEKLRKFGRQILEDFEILDHSSYDLKNLVSLGLTEDGTEVLVNRKAVEADLLIGIGQIVPHGVAGFSGGGKIVQPGVCGEATTGWTHWLSVQYDESQILGVRDNPVRTQIDAIAQKVGLDLIINSVPTSDGRIAAVVVGDPVEAHRKGCQIATELFGVPLPKLADIVLTDSYPADSNLWQAAKGLYSAATVVRQGGVVILVTPCPEGVAPEYPDFLANGYLSPQQAWHRFKIGKIRTLTVAAHLARVGKLIRNKARTILVSPGISPQEAERLGLLYGQTAKDALQKAFSLLGSDARVAVLRCGGQILPLLAK